MCMIYTACIQKGHTTCKYAHTHKTDGKQRFSASLPGTKSLQVGGKRTIRCNLLDIKIEPVTDFLQFDADLKRVCAAGNIRNRLCSHGGHSSPRGRFTPTITTVYFSCLVFFKGKEDGIFPLFFYVSKPRIFIPHFL